MAQKTFNTEGDEYKKQRVLEAALFMANKPLPLGELCTLAKCDEEKLIELITELQLKYNEGDSAIEISVTDSKATMQIKAQWLGAVAALSEKVELHKKSMKMLALVAKKGELLQSDLRKYFRGDIYEYVGELREKGYLERAKHGHSWKLKPTKKFHEEFQIAGLIEQAKAAEQEQSQGENVEKN